MLAMKWRTDPRPLSIRVFTAAFLAAALVRLLQGLNDLDAAGIWLARYLGDGVRSHDVLIVLLSAEFTIALIPVVWIYGFANRHARWLVLGFGGAKLALFAYALAQWLASGGGGALLPQYTAPALTFIALAALLSESATRWLNPEKAAHVAVFE
jgi:hypothetical protein